MLECKVEGMHDRALECRCTGAIRAPPPFARAKLGPCLHSAAAAAVSSGKGAHVGKEESLGGVDCSVHDVLHLAHGAGECQRLVVGGHQVACVALGEGVCSVLHKESNGSHILQTLFYAGA